jgi:heat shock protein HslJ
MTTALPTHPDSLTISNVGSTKIGGSVEEMQFEQTYYANLKAVTRYEITNKLRLYYEGTQPGVLVYEKVN